MLLNSVLRREMELYEHARPKQATPPYQPPMFHSTTPSQLSLSLPAPQQPLHHPQQPLQQPQPQRLVQVIPSNQQNVPTPPQLSGFNFEPAPRAAAAARPTNAPRSSNASPPRNALAQVM